VPESDFPQQSHIEIGDLVTYRSIKELSQENYQQKIVIHGVGIVIQVDEEYAKVYWIHAQQFLWVITDKLTTFNDLTPRY